MSRGCKASITEVSAVSMARTENLQVQGSIGQGMFVFGAIAQTVQAQSALLQVESVQALIVEICRTQPAVSFVDGWTGLANCA